MSDATTARRKAKNTKACGNCDWFDDRRLFCQWEDPTVALPLWARHDKEQRYVSPMYGAGKCRAWRLKRELAEAAEVAAQRTNERGEESRGAEGRAR